MAVSQVLEIPQVAPTQTDKSTTMNDAVQALEWALNRGTILTPGTVTALDLTWGQFVRNVQFELEMLTATTTLTVPSTTPTGRLPAQRRFGVKNGGTEDVIVQTDSLGASVTLAAGAAGELWSDGIDIQLLATGAPGPTGATGAVGPSTTVIAGAGIDVSHTGSIYTVDLEPIGALTFLANVGSTTVTPGPVVLGSGFSIVNTNTVQVNPSVGTVGGDLSGTLPNPTVAKINGAALGTMSVNAGKVLIGSGTVLAAQSIAGDATLAASGTLTLIQHAFTTLKALDWSGLPSSDPGGGLPWLNGNFVCVGS